LYGAKVVGRISLPMYLKWAGLADRHLIDERDSAFGLAVGARPTHDEPEVNRGIGLAPRRTTRVQLDDLFKELTDSRPPHDKIGTVWTSGQKDHALVLALVAGTRYGGEQTEIIALSLGIDTDVPLKVVGGREVEMIPIPIPRTPSAEITTTVAHETSHAFGLGDEYGEFSRIPADEVATLATNLNLQDEDSLTTATPPFLPKLDGSKLKWLWPRIAKAGVLAGTPTAVGGKFEVPVQPKHQLPFKPGDPVRIRARPLKPGLVPSDLMFVSDGGVQPGKLVIEPSPAAPVVVSPVTFGVDSLIYSPVLQPVSGNPVLLVHAAVQAHITTTGQPLNAPAAPAPARKCGDEGKDDHQSQPASNRPAGLKLPPGTFTAWIVGAYENGAEYFCGVYHPAGACIMRSRVFHRSLPDEKVFTMCPVCRYVLVDQFAPTQHGRLDLWYKTRYPLDG
jgi:hypothetical protein